MHNMDYENSYKIHRTRSIAKPNMPMYYTLHVVWGHASLIKTKEQAGLRQGTPAEGGTSPGPHNVVTGTHRFMHAWRD
jgi:hypothetical protein